MTDTQNTAHEWTGTFQAFHSSGIKATLPVGCSPIDYVGMFANLSAAVAAGWLLNAPGLVEGEEREEVNYVTRAESEKDGIVTPVVLLFDEKRKWAFLKVYLNNPQDIADFEKASGMKLMSLPLYISRDKPERGASKSIDSMIIKVSRPFNVILDKNPKWKKDEFDAAAAATAAGKHTVYGVPMKKFVRWPDLPAATDKPAETEKPQQTVAEKARQYIATLTDATALSKAGAMLDERRIEGRLTDDEHAELAALVMKKLDEAGAF